MKRERETGTYAVRKINDMDGGGGRMSAVQIERRAGERIRGRGHSWKGQSSWEIRSTLMTQNLSSQSQGRGRLS